MGNFIHLYNSVGLEGKKEQTDRMRWETLRVSLIYSIILCGVHLCSDMVVIRGQVGKEYTEHILG